MEKITVPAGADVRTVQTTRGSLRYYRDFDRYDGGIVMINPVTIDAYIQISGSHPEVEKYNVFFAFGKEQFDAGYQSLIDKGLIAPGDKIAFSRIGLYGRREDIDRFFDFYANRRQRVLAACDPQEVYFYEYNNYESQINWEGDTEAITVIIDTWGEEIARGITRYSVNLSIDDIVAREKS
jgi:hypothetical protein